MPARCTVAHGVGASYNTPNAQPPAWVEATSTTSHDAGGQLPMGRFVDRPGPGAFDAAQAHAYAAAVEIERLSGNMTWQKSRFVR